MKTLAIMITGLSVNLTCWGSDLIGIPHTASGDGDSLMPFGLRTLGLESMRYQQVYSGQPFAALYPGGMWIREIRFTDYAGRTWYSDQPQFQINLSTTARGPDSLSPVFAENVGVNDTVVFGPDHYTFGASSGETYAITLPMSQPFFFDPSQGNLLLDIRNYVPEEIRISPYQMWQPQRKQSVFGDPVSSVYAPDVNAALGTVDTLGLLTLFVVEVPEPSVGILLLAALAGLAIVRLWHAREKVQPREDPDVAA